LGGSLLVVAALARVATGGQDPRTLLLALGLAILIVGSLVGYGYLRQWNATVFYANGRLGMTNAFGVKAEIPIGDVAQLKKLVETDSAGKPVATLAVVSKEGKYAFRFRGADRLEREGLDRIIAELGLPVDGSW